MRLVGTGMCAALNVHAGLDPRLQCEDDFRIDPALGVAVVSSGNGATGAQGRAGAVLTTWSVIGEAEAAVSGMSGDGVLDAGFRRAHEVVDRMTWNWSAHKPVHSAAAVRLEGDRLWLAHVGTARVSRIESDRLTPLTEPHTFLNSLPVEQRAQWIEKYAEIDRVVTRALGMGAPDHDVAEIAVTPGEWFLIASPIVHEALTDAEIAEVLTAKDRSLAQMAADLMRELAAAIVYGRSVAFVIVGVGEGAPRDGQGGSSRPPLGWLFQPGQTLPEAPPEWQRETASRGPDTRWFEELAGPIMAL